MATVAQLLADLAALAHDVKRRNHDVRLAIDTAMSESGKVPQGSIVSEHANLQVALYLPFITALSSGNAKLVNHSLLVLLRLATLKSLNPDQLLLVIDSIHSLDLLALALETQLKILQTSPPLTQNYTLDRDHFLRLAAICSVLASSSNVVVANTASATLQQVFSSLFEKLRNHTSSESSKTFTVVIDGDTQNEKVATFQVDELELECFYIFLDLSAVVEGGKLEFFDASEIKMRSQAALEVIESIISQNGGVFETHEELNTLLKSKTVPALLKVLNSKTINFPLAVRTHRILHVLITSHMRSLEVESEIFVSYANHMLHTWPNDGIDLLILQPATSHSLHWQQVLILEFYKGIFSKFDTVRQIYDIYDGNARKKNVLHEILSSVSSFLQVNFEQFFRNDTIQMPQDRSSNQLSKSSSTLKVAVLDLLDKVDPPASIPSLYTANLIFKMLMSFAEGVSEFVTNLSVNATSETLESDVEFVTSMNEEVFPEIFQLFKKYIYCSMDSEYFHSCIRALQKYTHAIGLLGLSSLRDGLLLTLSECCIKIAVPDESKKNGASQLLSFGESIVESLSSTIQSPSVKSPSTNLVSQLSDQSSTVKQSAEDGMVALRSFNSRQVVCFRALSNLATSLGSTLQNSWKIIWITFQWVDYFMKGPDQFSSYPNPKDIKKYGEPKLSTQDVNTMEVSINRFLESVNEYQQSSFQELIVVLTELYDGTNFVTDKVNSLDICPFNKTYFVDQLAKIAEINPQKFLFSQDESWNLLVDYFITLGAKRSIAYGSRIYVVNRFTGVIVNVTRQGFESDDEHIDQLLAEKSLTSLLGFLTHLISLGRPQEHLVLNCETELRLAVFTTVHGLIDSYVEKYQNSWDLVFEILNTAFIDTEEKYAEANINEKISSLISTSFGTLKLILDEFLTSLPPSQLKSLIDTLLSFCSQKYDLNISFSSVSYFWLVSDCINTNEKELAESNSSSLLDSVSDLTTLQDVLASSTDLAVTNLALNIYLLAQLSNLSTDRRARVREGALQTLFQIIDVQGKSLPSSKMVYSIVLPQLLDLSLCFEIEDNTSRNDAIESLNLILSGLVSMFTKFLMDFKEENDSLTFAYWKTLFQFFDDLFKLNWKKLNMKIFQSYRDLIQALTSKSAPDKVVHIFFEFWVNVSIDYDFVNPEYQDALAVYNSSFKPLYKIIEQKLDFDSSAQVLNNLNKCARYPVLKAGLNDSAKPTDLQKSVLDNLLLINKKGNNEEILSSVIQQLAMISSYPFETKSRIEAKLKSVEGKLKIPSFIAVSELALDMLQLKLRELSSTKVLLADKGFGKLVRSLLYLVRYKAQGIAADGKDPLWVRCNDIIVYLVKRLVEDHPDGSHIHEDIWVLIVDCITACFEQLAEADAKYNVRQYEQLTQTVLPLLFCVDVSQNALVERLVFNVYKQSFLYDLNDIERELVGDSLIGSPAHLDSAYLALSNFQFLESFGTTAQLRIYANREIRLKCLSELYEFATAANSSSPIALKFLIARSAFTLRRFTADERLLLRKPLPKIQREEIAVVLQGLQKVGSATSPTEMAGIYRLLSQSIPYVSRLDNISHLVEAILRDGHAT